MATGEHKRSSHLSEVLSQSLSGQLFPPHLEVVPQLNEVYELELAFLESRLLSDEEILRNGAYFARVGDALTRHFLMCSGEPVHLPAHSSSRLRSFFKTNQFKTGYATHGLFPYRGKFHPQMIKGLLNVMGLKPGDTVLDPMMGSGTVLIEARLMGIHSYGIDASPFCRFMAQAKIDAMRVPLAPVRAALADSEAVFGYFSGMAGHPVGSDSGKLGSPATLFAAAEAGTARTARLAHRPEGLEDEVVHDFLLLAHLDSAGYAARSSRKPPLEQFKAILERYLFVAEKIQLVLAGAESELGEAKPLEGDAREVPFQKASLDGVVFSPPYSFAIDYLKNDASHLNFMGVDMDALRDTMVGLRGTTLRRKFEAYKVDMERILAECGRVLRPGRICTIVVGTNSNQLSKLEGVAPDEVQGMEDLMVELGRPHGLQLVRKLGRQITGMANTMRTEYIVMLQRV